MAFRDWRRLHRSGVTAKPFCAKTCAMHLHGAAPINSYIHKCDNVINVIIKPQLICVHSKIWRSAAMLDRIKSKRCAKKGKTNVRCRKDTNGQRTVFNYQIFQYRNFQISSGFWVAPFPKPGWTQPGAGLKIILRRRLGHCNNTLGIFRRKLLGIFAAIAEQTYGRAPCVWCIVFLRAI